ncbi:MAG: hypothetical protein JWS12_130 [Candidatus Saccharibacteria bacterium]|nr:hypothetical protein [Candidatus Saccharibacteria bacterium]
MSEQLSEPAEKPHYPLIYGEYWPEVLEEPEYQDWLQEQVVLTKTGLSALPAPPEWADNEAQISVAWQRAAEVVADASYWPYQVKDVPPINVLKNSIGILQESINQTGWQIEGVAFSVADVREPPTRPKLIDIRGLITPTPIIDMDFDTFLTLSNEEIEALQKRITAAFATRRDHASNSWFDSPVFSQVFRDAGNLHDYRKWKRYGKPDRDLDYEELQIRMEDCVANRLLADPNYGAYPEETWQQLADADKNLVFGILQYLWSMRALYDYPDIDTYSLGQFGDTAIESAQKLAKRGVLVKLGSYTDLGGFEREDFSLNEELYAFWLKESVKSSQEE